MDVGQGVSGPSAGVYITTRIKKKDAPSHLLIEQTKKLFKNFSIESILKIFKFSSNLDQSQVHISNRLKVTASQRQLLF